MIFRISESRLNSGAGRRCAGRNPFVPNRIHLCEATDISEPDVSRNDVGLVAVGGVEQRIDSTYRLAQIGRLDLRVRPPDRLP